MTEVSKHRRIDPAQGPEFIHGDMATQIGDKHYVAMKQIHGGFRAAEVLLFDLPDFKAGSVRGGGIERYMPIHPSMTLDDINNATYALDDGTHWHFFHGWKGEHQDFLLNLIAVVNALFAPGLRKALFKTVEASNAVAKTKASTAYNALVDFEAAVSTAAVEASKAHPMGHYGANPHQEEGHAHKIVREAIKAVQAEWSKTQDMRTKWSLISARVLPVSTMLATPHTPLTKHQIAEAAKKKAEAETPAETPSEQDTSGS